MQKQQPLSALEQQLAQVIAAHPEYHPLLNHPEQLDQDYNLDEGNSNPFLHMGLHLALLEQVSNDRPQGIRALYQQFLQHSNDWHQCEHQMMTPLAESIWQAQANNRPPSEQDYLHALTTLLQRQTRSQS